MVIVNAYVIVVITLESCFFSLFRSIGDLCPAGSSSCSQHLLTSGIDEPASENVINVPIIALPGISGSVCWVLFFCINQNCSGLWCELVFLFSFDDEDHFDGATFV